MADYYDAPIVPPKLCVEGLKALVSVVRADVPVHDVPWTTGPYPLFAARFDPDTGHIEVCYYYEPASKPGCAK